jgi:hypothetical protein
MSSQATMLAYEDKKLSSSNFNGPVSARRCTDVFCLILFILFNIGLVIVAITGFNQSGGVNGYKRLINGVGSDGRICGISGVDGAGVANSHQFTSFTSSGNVIICIPACPTSDHLFTLVNFLP